MENFRIFNTVYWVFQTSYDKNETFDIIIHNIGIYIDDP